MSKIRLQLFGAFRKYHPDSLLEIPFENPMMVKNFRKHVLGELCKVGIIVDAQLLADSALATEESILTELDVISVGQTIAILPPVCGG